MYGIDIELSDYHIGSSKISEESDGYYEGWACEVNERGEYGQEGCRAVSGRRMLEELVLFVGDDVVSSDQAANMVHSEYGKLYFLDPVADSVQGGKVSAYANAFEAIELAPMPGYEGEVAMEFVVPPTRAHVRFFETQVVTEPSSLGDTGAEGDNLVSSVQGNGQESQDDSAKVDTESSESDVQAEPAVTQTPGAAREGLGTTQEAIPAGSSSQLETVSSLEQQATEVEAPSAPGVENQLSDGAPVLQEDSEKAAVREDVPAVTSLAADLSEPALAAEEPREDSVASGEQEKAKTDGDLRASGVDELQPQVPGKAEVQSDSVQETDLNVVGVPADELHSKGALGDDTQLAGAKGAGDNENEAVESLSPPLHQAESEDGLGVTGHASDPGVSDVSLAEEESRKPEEGESETTGREDTGDSSKRFFFF
ncbi:hypothetical protein [Candidatus Anaplasma sp. TIGMIC]|uniref:hypothetical protein n=1 Tax=Candidatus Anaplasma sp. TIGMIC TaxID=3020713 RepID=UPI00232B46BA|nr:hypothetical protein [Candidatus Anaplasma sp. TIGMIC]